MEEKVATGRNQPLLSFGRRGEGGRKTGAPPLPVPLLHSEWRRGWQQAGRGAVGLWGRLENHSRRVGRHKKVVLDLAQNFPATGAPVQCRPNFQQHARAIVPPLAIPETQFLDVQRGQKLFTKLIPLMLFRYPVLKAVQFHRQPCCRTIKVEPIFSHRMLPTKFEAGKSSCPQCTPKFLFLGGLFTAETAGVGRGIHRCKDRKTAVSGKHLPAPPLPVPLLHSEGEGGRRTGIDRSSPSPLLSFGRRVKGGRKPGAPPLPVPLLHSEWRRGWPQAGRGGAPWFGV